MWSKAHERYVERLNRGRQGGRISVQTMTSARSGDAPPLPDVREETIRFWWAPPDRLREEVTSNVEHQERTTVWNGDRWWLHGPALGAISNELLDEEERANHGVGGGEHFRPLLDPSWLSGVVELDEIRPGDGVLHVRARLRDELEGGRHFQLPLSGGADDYELEVDAELGYLRAVTALLDGAELASTRLEELVLGETLPDDTFVFTPPPGVEVEPPGGRTRRVTLEEAAAEAQFTVFAVPELPDGHWRLHVNLSRRPRPAVWLVYHRSDGRGSINVSQSAEPNGVADDERTIALERDGTHILMQADGIPVDTLRELAERLEPVRP